jgi:RNA polymerase-associated protein
MIRPNRLKICLNLTPRHSPTLIERDLVLYDSRIIMEYLDERFPHLLTPDGPGFTRNRQNADQTDRPDWYQLLGNFIFRREKISPR